MIIPTGFAQVNYFLIGGALPRNAQIVIGVENSTPLTASAVASAASAAFQDSILDLLPETVTLEKVKAKLGPNATGPEATVAAGVPGSLTDVEAMSPNVAILVSKLTATGGKANAGKMFIPAFGEDDTTGGGFLTPAALTAWQAAIDDFMTQLSTNDIPLVILHTDVLVSPTTVTDMAVQQRLATQKRRLRRAGGRRTAP